jgi:hypothetical protein
MADMGLCDILTTMRDEGKGAPGPGDDPFEPPRPEGVSAGEMVAGTASLLGIVVLDTLTGGLLTALTAIPDCGGARAPAAAPGPSTALPVSQQRPDGLVTCTRCAAAVPYESMSLNQDGYFCGACAAAMTRPA